MDILVNLERGVIIKRIYCASNVTKKNQNH